MSLLQKIEDALVKVQVLEWGAALPCRPYPIIEAEFGDFATDICIRLAGERKQTIQNCVGKVFAGLGDIGVEVSETRGYVNFKLPVETSWAVKDPSTSSLTIVTPALWRELGAAAAVRFLSFVFQRARAAARLGISGQIIPADYSGAAIGWQGASDTEWYQIGRKLFDMSLTENKPPVSALLAACAELSNLEVWCPAVLFPDTAISATERELARSRSVLKLMPRTMLGGFDCEQTPGLIRTLPQEEFFNLVAALTVPEQGGSINPSLYKYITIDSPRAFGVSLRARLNSVLGAEPSADSELCISAQPGEQRVVRLLKSFRAWQVYAGVSGEIVQYSKYQKELLTTINRYLNDPKMRSALAAGRAGDTSREILLMASWVLMGGSFGD